MITNKEVRISVNKTLTRKLIYVVAALTLLAMMIPAMAIPVSAAPASLKMYAVDPTNTANYLTGEDSGYNIKGSIVEVRSSDQDVSWSISDWNLAQILSGNTTRAVRVQGGETVGNISIDGTNSGNQTASIGKKWGLIDHTDISAGASGSSEYVTWNEDSKKWEAAAVTITDTVYGNFVNVSSPYIMEGAILDWYLLPANVYVDLSTGEWLDHAGITGLQNKMNTLMANNQVQLVSFDPNTMLDTTTNVSGALGTNSVKLYAKGEEAVQVICIAHYPSTINTQLPITPERITYDFFTTESEVVPQVRWAGEKIVLEKYFGPSYNGALATFSLQNQSIGALEAITGNGSDSYSNSVSVTVVNGFASAILTSSDQGEANVVAGLYQGGKLINQHYFTVYFLKLESVQISDVNGKRAQHNAGLWNPDNPNPWSTATDYGINSNPAQTLNVSQDALVRARVKGWFTSNNPGTRPVRLVDPANSTLSFTPDTPGTATLTLPAGRWVLPDDWAKMAGTNWKQSRIHWDIMNTVGGNSTPAGTEYAGAAAVSMANPAYNATTNPNVPKNIENVAAAGQLGDYYLYVGTDYKYKPAPAPAHTQYPIVGDHNVIGPFSPGLELMTPAGWQIVSAPTWDATYRNMHTVVPDGYLDWWDAPMPPAKVIYQIQSGGATKPNKNEVGYFKAVNKTDIYYVWATNTAWTSFTDDPNDAYDQYIKVYTNPFYQEMIPAHEAIPAFINNGGYDWASFSANANNGIYGPYVFWQFINQNRYLPVVTSSDPSGHPTCVEVYSDNHGEAMVWLNGNWNLYFGGTPNYLNKGAVDAPYNATLGTTTIQATVDYPYSRLHQAFQSNLDTKTWLWGGLILGTDEHQYANGDYSVGDQTRMVLSAGTWVGYPNGKTGTYPNENAISKDQVVWVWVSDRDGKAAGVLNNTVEWIINNASGSAARISARTCNTPNDGISQYNEVTKNIFLTNGFLTGTNGSITDGTTRLHALSTLRAPTTVEKVLFNKFWGYGYKDPVSGIITTNATSTLVTPTSYFDPNNFCVAAIDLEDLIGANNYSRCSVTANIYGNDYNPLIAPPALPVPPTTYVQYLTNINFANTQPLDDAIRAGDANCDGVVNMGDVTAVERMILGYTATSQNAVLNSDGTVDMGTVVKIERTILGLR
jgi:hypothetical protein